MVSVSFMIRGQHQSSGIIRQRKEEDVVLIFLFYEEKTENPKPSLKMFFSFTTHRHFRPLQAPNPPPLSVSRLSLLLLNGPAPPTCTHNSPVSNSSSSLFVRLSSHSDNNLRAQTQAGFLICALRNTQLRTNHKSVSWEVHSHSHWFLSFVFLKDLTSSLLKRTQATTTTTTTTTIINKKQNIIFSLSLSFISWLLLPFYGFF